MVEVQIGKKQNNQFVSGEEEKTIQSQDVAEGHHQPAGIYPSHSKPHQKERIPCFSSSGSDCSHDVLDDLEEENRTTGSKCTCEITAEYSAHAYFLVPLFQQSNQGRITQTSMGIHFG